MVSFWNSEFRSADHIFVESSFIGYCLALAGLQCTCSGALCRTCESKLEGAFRQLKSGERRDRNLYILKEDKAILKVIHVS